MAEFNLDEIKAVNARLVLYPDLLPDSGSIPFRELIKKSPTGVEVVFPVRINGVDMPNEPLVKFSYERRVAITAMFTGLDFVEDLGRKNLKIEISGFITSSIQDVYPIEEVRLFKQLLDTGGALEVEGKLFETLGIYELQILTAELPAVEGLTDAQPYTIQAIEVNSRELEITEDSFNEDITFIG